MYQRGTIFQMRAGYATRKIKFTWPDCQFVEYLFRIQNNRIKTSYIIFITQSFAISIFLF